MLFVWISERTANCALHNIKRLVFITVVESVYCAVRTESLYNTYVSSLKRLKLYYARLISLTVRYLSHGTGCVFAVGVNYQLDANICLF